MRLLLFSVFIILRSIDRGSSTEINENLLAFTCKNIKATAPSLRLKQYLFCDYDQDVRPIEDPKNTTNVTFEMIPQSFDIDESTNVITLHTWLALMWKDAHLVWEPSKYNDIRWFSVTSEEVWVPDITLYNAGDADVSVNIPRTNCWLSYMGNVHCVPTIVEKAACIADHTWWPYDTANCTFQFGAWSHSSEEIRIHFLIRNHQEETINFGYQKSLQWQIEQFYVTERVQSSKFDQTFNTKIGSYHFILRRHASMHTVLYVVPALALMVLTLMTLWLEPNSMERIILANVAFICHLLCIYDVHWKITANGAQPPNLLLFFDNSFVLATFSLILTSVLRHVQNIKAAAPVWISSTAATILQSKIGQILLISVLDPKASAKVERNADDNTDLVSSRKGESAWNYLVLLVGWIAFFAVSIIYVVMLVTLLPTSTSGKISTVNT